MRLTRKAMMVGLSGFACLVYQILWMRQLGLMLGNTSHAAALSLAVFFGGLAVGSWFWGRKSHALAHPLRSYAKLELGIALCGLMIMVAPTAFAKWYPAIHQRHGDGAVLGIYTFLWTWLMVFPPAMLMGGTLPVMAQTVIREMRSFGRISAQLYAINTIGAACGAFATSFVFIAWLGMRVTCAVAMMASALVAVMAYLTPGDTAKPVHQAVAAEPKIAITLPRYLILALAFVSGFQVLALEVIWTRMMAQVHENSVYSFAAVLIVVLLCLAVGAWLASLLARRATSVMRSLLGLIVMGAVLLILTPFIFSKMTHQGAMLPTDRSFSGYVWQIFSVTLFTVAPACIFLGAVFPLLMKCEESYAKDAGKSLGNLASVNTLGAILGAMVAGFFLLEYAGVWRSMQIISVIYLLLVLLLPLRQCPVGLALKLTAAGMLLIGLTILSPSRVPQMVSRDQWGKPDVLIEKWESSDATVTVVKDSQEHVSIKINSSYSLGATYAYAPQMQQARLPLLAFPQTDRIFFLGMGTGITAGEALDRKAYPRVRRVVTSEISPAVVAASKKYFAGGMGDHDITNGLYVDPRSEVLIGDGRHQLLASPERYKMINADLFLPYRRGAGNLYSREHFQQALTRLEPGGVFVQWLPLYQMTEEQFGTIARTMLAVFPQVSLWRGNFQPGAEMAALVGHADESPLPACQLDTAADQRAAIEGATHLHMQELMLPINEQTILLFYGGNLTHAADEFAKYPLNTDDKPMIEFGTPRSLHRSAGEEKPHFVQERFAAMVDRLQERTPPQEDPLLSLRTQASRQLPLAGSAFHRAWIARVAENATDWQEEWRVFCEHWLSQE